MSEIKENYAFQNLFVICPQCGKRYSDGRYKCKKCNSPVMVFAEYNKLIDKIRNGVISIDEIDTSFHNIKLLKKKILQSSKKRFMTSEELKWFLFSMAIATIFVVSLMVSIIKDW